MSFRNLRVITMNDFGGGLNTKAGPGALADNEYSIGQNIYLWERGIAKRDGFIRYNDSARISTTNAGLGIVEAPFVSASKIVGVAGSLIKTKGTNLWSDITGSVVLTSGKPVLFCMQNNVLIGVNGTDPAWYYTGSGNATTLAGTNIPTAPAVCESFHGRLFLAAGRNLSWSNYMGSWTTFSASDIQYFEDNITGLKICGDGNDAVMLILLKNGGVYKCKFDTSIGGDAGGTNCFAFDRISEKHGCASIFSVQECVMDDGTITVIWADWDGLKAAIPSETGLKVIKITENVQPDWDNLNFNKLTDSVGVFYKPKRWYMLFYADVTDSTHTRVLLFDLRYWKVFSFWDLTVATMGIIKVDNVETLIGSDYEGYWNQYDYGYNDNNAAINGYFYTKAFNGTIGYPAPFVKKDFKSVGIEYAVFGDYDINIASFFDDKAQSISTVKHTPGGAVLDSTFILDESVLAADSELAIYAKRIFGIGKSIQLSVSNAKANEPFRIHRIHISYQPICNTIF